MKKFHFIFLMIPFLLATSCSKDELEVISEETTNDPSAVVAYAGSFVTEVHTTSGKVSVLKSTNGDYSLKIEDLKSDAGPDLRIWIAEDKRAANYIEVSDVVKNGTYTLDLPKDIDYSKRKYVLIWCKQFSVLFGSAELK